MLTRMKSKGEKVLMTDATTEWYGRLTKMTGAL